MPRVFEPTDVIAQARSEAGLSRQMQQPRQRVIHNPSKGGTEGYPVRFRQQQIQKFVAGEPIDVCHATIYNWNNTPYRKTGGRERTHIVGLD